MKARRTIAAVGGLAALALLTQRRGAAVAVGPRPRIQVVDVAETPRAAVEAWGGADGIAAIVGASEDPRGPDADLFAILATVYNRSEAWRRDLWTVATGGGTTGSQVGRPYSSARWPVGPAAAWLIAAAGAVRRDPNRWAWSAGATYYIHVAAQRALARRGGKSPEQVDAARRAAGLQRVYPAGTDGQRVWYWG